MRYQSLFNLFSAVTTCLVILSTLASPATAASPEKPKTILKKVKYDYLGFSLGTFDVLDNETAIEARLEYAVAKPILGPLKPLFVAEITEDSSFYTGAGLYIDYMPTRNLYIKPSFVAGVYEDGDGKDLGDGAIFRSQLEAGIEFETGHRLGIAFSHLSNGWQDKDNAGTEVVSLYFHFPTNSLFTRKKNGLTTLPSK